MTSILLIEDEELVRLTVRFVLEGAGYEVIEARDGIEAIAKFKRGRPSLVLTDVVMPNMEGNETIRDLRRLDPDVPIIAMSGGGRTGAASLLDAAKRSGASGALPKPFSPEALIEAVAGHLA